MLKALREQLEIEGYAPDSPQFKLLFVKRKTEMCQQFHKVPQCQACIAFDNCELSKIHLQNMAFLEKVKKPG
jgi:hypothetical protein